MSELQPFAFEGQSVRAVLDERGEPWFVANDVCAILGYANARKALTDHVDPDDVTKRDAIDDIGRTQQTNHVNESGLYALILCSHLPKAKEFKRWITSEVLPSIRKTGTYGIRQIDVRDPSQLAQVAVQLIEYTRELETKTKTLEGAVEQAKPKVDFYDRYANADGLYGLQNAARVLQQKPNLFIRRLKAGYLFYQGGALLPRQPYIQRGLFEVKTVTVDERVHSRTYVTPKGIQYFAKLLAKEQQTQGETAACS